MEETARPLDVSVPEARRVEALASIASSIAHSRDLDASLSEALDTVLRVLAVEAGGLYLLDEDSGELRATPHHRGLPDSYPDAVSRFRRGEAVIGRALDSVAPVVVRDLAASAEARDATRAVGLRSVAFVPLYARGRAVGMMAVGGYSIRDFLAEELQLLSAVGGILGAAIDNARLSELSQRNLTQVEALWEVDRALAEDRDTAEVLSVVVREAAELGGGDAAILLGPADALVIAASHGDRPAAVLGNPLSLGGRPVASLLSGSEPVTVKVPGEPPLRAVLAGLGTGGHTLGALLVLKLESQWRGDEVQPLAAFAGRAAAALARADARQAAARRASQLALLAGAAEIAASTLEVESLLGATARYIQRSFGYYAVTIYLVLPESKEARLAGAAGEAATVIPRGNRVPFGTGIIGWVAEHGQYVLASDVRKEPRFVSAGLSGTASELAVPVHLGGEVVAVINVESDQLDAFDEGDRVAVDGIAAQMASAIRNARLFDEKLRALRNLEVMQEITNVLNSELELGALLDRIARRSVEVVRPAHRGAVLLFDDDTLIVRSSFGYANPSALRRVRMAFHEGLPGSVFVTGVGRAARVTPADYGSHAAAFREAAGEEPKGALCVPIALPQEKLGVLLLETGTSPDAFRGEDLRFASTLAHQAAIAIGNALRLERMREMDRQRQGYLSNVSHELRTPLTVIQGYVEALSAGSWTEEAQRFLRITQEQCQRLGRMIDEVLEVSRLEQGVAQRHLEWGPVSLSSLVRKVLKVLRQEATLKHLVVSTRVDPDLPLLAGDERLLHLLVLNLVDNAVKFTESGGRIDIVVHGAAEEIVLQVRDDGVGIPREHQDRIFEKFFMVDGGAAKTRPGAGIGLYLAREVVAIHEGRMQVESSPGHGACFEVRLPLRARKAAPAPPAAGKSASL